MSDGDPEESKKEMAEKLRAMFEAAGLPVPESAALNARLIPAALPPDETARRIADYLTGRDLLFRRRRDIGTIDPTTGEWEPMTAHRFRTWLPATAGIIPVKGFDEDSGKSKKSWIKVEDCRTVLDSDELIAKLPEVHQTNLVRLPVLREETDDRGFRQLDLLDYGYDAETQSFTVRPDHLADDYPTDIDPNEGFVFLKHVFKYFEWGDPDLMPAVQLGAMMTVFCKEMFRGRPPMFLWNSNLPGSGKSRLSQLVLELVYGKAGKAGYHFTDPNEVRKQLDAAAEGRSGYVWFDDTNPGEIRSTDLNRFLTAKIWEFRRMHTHENVRAPLRAAVFMTGTGIELDPAIRRRTLVVDLFARQAARDREIPDDAIMLDDDFFDEAEKAEQRGKVLGALWSLVRYWDAEGRPKGNEKALASFEGWSTVVPGIVQAPGFENPLKAFEAPDSGGSESAEWRELVRKLVEKHCKPSEDGGAFLDHVEIKMSDVVRCARMNSLFVDPLGDLAALVDEAKSQGSFEWPTITDGEEWEDEDGQERWYVAGLTTPRVRSAWGKKFKRAALAGQWFNVGGEVWQFGDRKRKAIKGVCFELKRIIRDENETTRSD